jgi:hemerythrin
MFEWKDEYSVGIGSIDGQHRNLFALAGELYAAMSAGQGNSVAGSILNRLIRYTKVHFAYEEHLMQQYDYPAYASHKREHDALTERVIAFQADFEGGKVAMTIQLLQFLQVWLEHHIKEADTAYRPYIKATAT